MRTQYSFWPGEDGLDAWDVERLIALSQSFTVTQVHLTALWELDTNYWGLARVEDGSVRWVAEHLRLALEADTSYPIILGANGRVMDGMHRIVRALVEGRETIDAVRFSVDPEPDYRNCNPDELAYEER